MILVVDRAIRAKAIERWCQYVPLYNSAALQASLDQRNSHFEFS